MDYYMLTSSPFLVGPTANASWGINPPGRTAGRPCVHGHSVDFDTLHEGSSHPPGFEIMAAGGSISANESKNRKVYGKEFTNEAILTGAVPPQPDFEPLYTRLSAMVEVRWTSLC
jgi:hypothetical protein